MQVSDSTMMKAALVLILIVTPGSLLAETQQQFRDCEDCPVMIALPLGEFVMGTPEQARNTPELPHRRPAPATLARRTRIAASTKPPLQACTNNLASPPSPVSRSGLWNRR